MDFDRDPYQEVFIKALNFQHHKIAVSGSIIRKGEDTILLDDGTGSILVHAAKIPQSDFVKVYGRLLTYENGFELQAEFVQDYSRVDKELLRKIKELLR